MNNNLYLVSNITYENAIINIARVLECDFISATNFWNKELALESNIYIETGSPFVFIPLMPKLCHVDMRPDDDNENRIILMAEFHPEISKIYPLFEDAIHDLIQDVYSLVPFRHTHGYIAYHVQTFFNQVLKTSYNKSPDCEEYLPLANLIKLAIQTQSEKLELLICIDFYMQVCRSLAMFRLFESYKPIKLEFS